MSALQNEILVGNSLDRRKFVKGIGMAGLGVAGATLLWNGSVEKAFAAIPASDVNVLNFALNLEYLEAEFYSVAMTGKTLTQLGLLPVSATSGPTRGGHKVRIFDSDGDNDTDVQAILTNITRDEQEHVAFLRKALGSAAIKKPAIDLDALGLGFSEDRDFLNLARAFEDTGVSAYAGGLPLLENKTIVAAAGRIALVEAYHAGSIRLKVSQQHDTVLRIDGKDILPSFAHLYTENGGLAVARTPQEVLRIVYHGGTSRGGFFPDGVNGTIHVA